CLQRAGEVPSLSFLSRIPGSPGNHRIRMCGERKHGSPAGGCFEVPDRGSAFQANHSPTLAPGRRLRYEKSLIGRRRRNQALLKTKHANLPRWAVKPRRFYAEDCPTGRAAQKKGLSVF